MPRLAPVTKMSLSLIVVMVVQTPADARSERREADIVIDDGDPAGERPDSETFQRLVEPYVSELRVHCYRILGSVPDAEDVLQETLMAAWRGLPRFEQRSSLRVWLYRIATNRCLNALRSRARRPEELRSMTEPPEPTRRADPIWVEPYPDTLLDGRHPLVALGPEVRYEATESMALGFVAALQHLPPRQRCVLVLRDVLGLPADEVAGMLDTTEGSVKGALQRARATLRSRLADGGVTTLPRSSSDRAVVDRFVTAVEAGDIDSVVALLAEDAWVTMPPEPYEYQGRDAVVRFLLDRAQRRGANLRLVATSANGQPAFGCYLPDAHTPMAHAYGLLVLTLRRDHYA